MLTRKSKLIIGILHHVPLLPPRLILRKEVRVPPRVPSVGWLSVVMLGAAEKSEVCRRGALVPPVRCPAIRTHPR